MQKLKEFVRKNRRSIGIGAAVVAVLAIVIQIAYPAHQLPLFLRVDGVSVGGMTKDEATKLLDEEYKSRPVLLKFNERDTATKILQPSDIGILVKNKQRITRYDYPLVWRFVPSSLLWYHLFGAPDQPEYQKNTEKTESFIAAQFGESCVVEPRDATIKVSGAALTVVPEMDGGVCSLERVRAGIDNLKITLDSPVALRVAIDITKPAVTTNEAKRVLDRVVKTIDDGVKVEIAGEVEVISKDEVYKWLTFATKDASLKIGIDGKKAASYLDKELTPKVAVTPGTTTIVTRDFTVVSEKKGKTGRTLDHSKTLESVLEVVQGDAASASAATKTVPAKRTYQRSYSKTPTGIRAMLQHYSDDHKGVYGVAYRELSGQKNSAEYNASKSFITASTYKLFVAYETLRRVEDGKWKWGDSVVGGRTLSTCFDDMIVKSDNPCAEALYEKIGYQKTIDTVRKLGLKDTVLASDGQRTSAGDLALFLRKLYDGSIDLKSSSRDRLIDAMKRNIYRNGIPAGTDGVVADKVGFLNGLLHDVSIVYSPKGDYVLVVMSDGGSWANIAEITEKIEALR